MKEVTDASHHKNFKRILIKFGGNAMTSEKIKENFASQIASLHSSGIEIIVAHGGGPFIQEILDDVGITSDFIGGHRVTTKKAMNYVEMALSGQVNQDIVNTLQKYGVRAVGLSGKDAGTVTAVKRKFSENGIDYDLGQVGDVDKIDPSYIEALLENGFLPVVSPVSRSIEGETLNVNADMFAGNLAGKLGVDAYIILTNVDGLLEDKDKPETIIKEIILEKLAPLFGKVIVGGMIPKIESAEIALRSGSKSAIIINGTTQNSLLNCVIDDKYGTKIIK